MLASMLHDNFQYKYMIFRRVSSKETNYDYIFLNGPRKFMKEI